MSTIGVDLGEVDELVSRMAAFARRLDAVDAETGRRVEQLHAGWRGTAAAAHRETHHRWSAAADEMRAALAELRAIVAAAHVNYASAVRANVGMWSR